MVDNDYLTQRFSTWRSTDVQLDKYQTEVFFKPGLGLALI